ncbi:MAG TPA: Asp-tRNA(Asn)/Glu-tRNA(Gln) amidotransferase subunit GatA [Candidatus Saccharimonadales bacterium]|nr:Asp-tRNA(Asn)/Glu-tRNA(Gln) amidotransferase subunit GatA [Candidatus Saccharimonadales bacterium]
MTSWPSIDQLREEISTGKTSASELVERSLDEIEKNSDYRAIIATTEKRAKSRAKEIDSKIKNKQSAGKLAGIPFIAKDNFLAFGADTTAASNILKGFEAPYQSTVIEKLEAEGAICVAKANLDAFAHGTSTENSDFMVTKNPHDKSRVPGGSSGGSAAAVVLGMAPFALGTDTGGSVRLPASFCGCVGYKPTYGLVSRSGIVAMASSLDIVGPLTNSVDDAGTILDIIAGRDDLDSTTINRDKKGYTNLVADIKGKKIGVVKEYMSGDLDPRIQKLITEAVSKLEKAGARISEISIPSLPLALAAYYIICPAELSSNLSRYDGQRFPYSFKDAKTLDESYLKTRSIGFGDEAKRRIMIGTYVLSSGYYDAYYLKAQTVRTKLINEFNEVFEEVDFLVGPTAPMTAFRIGEKTDDPLKMYLLDIMTVAANLVGVPAISLPAGDLDNLPVGLQLIAPQRADRALLNLAKAVEGVLR